MTFDDFKVLASKVENLELPGKKALFKMAPMERVKELKDVDIKALNPREAAVTALFYPNKDNQTFLILILRKTYKGVHSAQIGFPGGKVEPEDKDLKDTAKRETEEEVGVPYDDIQLIKKMTTAYIPPSNFNVHPFIGYLEDTPKLIKQDDEVEDIVLVDIDDFLNEDSLIEETLTTSYATELTVPAFHLNGHVVWGATAMMLSEIKTLFKQVL
ncbi:CoA pyrophosphatase [Croceibacter atlanticus]|jgi:8-oxo-dGTP pyrophosphatase MutT (NUDIX family)|uniref:NUDIX hydrolase n=1 Tax=Croceibacter atlanticus TaxID=313588 RepID=UPI002E166975|nr:CoA pyrophosphatase [Croceibacter atlanticus]|tara:strand:- start:36100 stop:36741 length:642 start_codon:yes stop_codon:yes gene_type:complete